MDASGVCPCCGLSYQRPPRAGAFLGLQSVLCFALPIAFFVGEATGHFTLNTVWATFYGVNVIGVSAAGYGFVKLKSVGLGNGNGGAA